MKYKWYNLMIYLSQLTIVTIVCNTTITIVALLEILIEMSLTLDWTTHKNFCQKLHRFGRWLVSDHFTERESFLLVNRTFLMWQLWTSYFISDYQRQELKIFLCSPLQLLLMIMMLLMIRKFLKKCSFKLKVTEWPSSHACIRE